MPSKALQIRDAIVSLLRTFPVAGVPASRVFLDEVSAVEHNDAAAIFVEMGDEPAPEFLVGATDRAVEITVGVVGVGADANAAADAVVVATHDTIMADRTLGGVAFNITEGPRRRDRRDLDRRLAKVECAYRVDYRCSGDSLES